MCLYFAAVFVFLSFCPITSPSFFLLLGGDQRCRPIIEQWLLTSEEILMVHWNTLAHTHVYGSTAEVQGPCYVMRLTTEECVKFEETGRKPCTPPPTTPRARLSRALKTRLRGIVKCLFVVGESLERVCSFTWPEIMYTSVFLCACLPAFFGSAKSELSSLIKFYRLLPELGGNGQANVLTTVQIHFTEDTR